MNKLRVFKGGALIIVLLISVALASVSALLIVKTKSHTERIKVAKEFLQAERNVVSDVSSFIFDIQSTPYFIMGDSALAPSYSSPLPKSANLYSKPFSYGSSVFQVQDAGGIVHLIPFNKEKVTHYLEIKNWPAEQIRNFLDSYADWVDKDDFTHLYGAESDSYQVAGFPFNNQLQSKSELMLLENVDKTLLASIVDDNNVILYNPGRENKDYSPFSMLALNLQEHEIETFFNARERWLNENASNPIDNYSSLNWLITVYSSYGDSKSSRMLHLMRRFGDTRPYVVSKWRERVD